MREVHLKRLIPYDILIKEDSGDNEKVRGSQRLGMDGRSTEVPRAVRLFWLGAQWWVSVFAHLPKPTESTTQA